MYQTIILPNLLPAPSIQRLLILGRLYNLRMQLFYLCCTQLFAIQSLQYHERLIRLLMSRKPARRLWNKEQEEENRDEEHALQNDGHTPRILGGNVREAEIDPVREEDAEIQRRKLGANVLGSALISH